MHEPPTETPPARVRDARPADAPALVRLQAVIYDEGGAFVGDGPPGVEALSRRLGSLDDSMSLYLVAEGATRARPAAGWLELHRFAARRLQHVALLTLAVHPDWRGRGAAGAMLERSYAWAQRVGVEKIQLLVRAGNTPAIRLYERHGFVIEGHERRQIKEGACYEDNLAMAKFLPVDSGGPA